MNNTIEDFKYKKIIYIGPTGKATWIGTLEGFRDMYPKCKIVKVKNKKI